MVKINVFILGTMSVLFLLAGCKKDLSNDGSGIDSGDYFDFRTANKQNVNVEYKVPTGYQVFFEAYAEYPVDTVNGMKKNMTPLFRGFVDEHGKYSETVQIPTYVNEVYLYSENIGVPTVTRMSLEGTRSRASRADDTNYEFSGHASIYEVMGNGKWNAAGVPEYLGTKKDISADGLKMLNSTLGNKDEHIADYIAESGEANLNVVEDGATIDVVIVHNGGNTRTNTIGYYYYPTTTNPSELSESDIQKIILLPNATFPNNGGLQMGDNVRLKYWDGTNWNETFPKGVTVGWFIVAGGYNSQTHQVDAPAAGRGIGYSNTEWSSTPGRQHNVIVRDPLTKTRYVGFEDQNFGGIPTYRDFIFCIEADGVEYNDGNIPDGKDMTDTDKDGIPDVDDEFPNDASKAYSLTYTGSLAFEDIWPYKGDYDMNDMVVVYNSTHYLNANNWVTSIKDQWTVKHVGAQLESGFGYQYEMLNFKVSTLKVTSGYTVSSRFPKNAKGLEDKQTKATIILFDNAKDVMSAAADARTFTVDIELSGPTRVSEINLPPYNPFIIVNTKEEGRGHELHLPNYQPTALMNVDLLHFGHDLSVPEKGIYYVSDNNLPFAIHIFGKDFEFPAESQKIGDAYPDFTKWASSKGEENKEWYNNPKK